MAGRVWASFHSRPNPTHHKVPVSFDVRHLDPQLYGPQNYPNTKYLKHYGNHNKPQPSCPNAVPSAGATHDSATKSRCTKLSTVTQSTRITIMPEEESKPKLTVKQPKKDMRITQRSTVIASRHAPAKKAAPARKATPSKKTHQ